MLAEGAEVSASFPRHTGRQLASPQAVSCCHRMHRTARQHSLAPTDTVGWPTPRSHGAGWRCSPAAGTSAAGQRAGKGQGRGGWGRLDSLTENEKPVVWELARVLEGTAHNMCIIPNNHNQSLAPPAHLGAEVGDDLDQPPPQVFHLRQAGECGQGHLWVAAMLRQVLDGNKGREQAYMRAGCAVAVACATPPALHPSPIRATLCVLGAPRFTCPHVLGYLGHDSQRVDVAARMIQQLPCRQGTVRCASGLSSVGLRHSMRSPTPPLQAGHSLV